MMLAIRLMSKYDEETSPKTAAIPENFSIETMSQPHLQHQDALQDAESLRIENSRLRSDLSDLLALRASEVETREKIERVQIALEAGAIVGTWNWHPANDIFIFDEGFAYVFGLSPMLAHVGHPIDEVLVNLHPEDRPGLDAAIAEAVGRGGAYVHHYRIKRSDNKYYWVEAHGRVDYDANGIPVSFPGIVIDINDRRGLEAERNRAITELRESEARIREMNDTLEHRISIALEERAKVEVALRQSQKMEAVGQLTGGLAHDFNNLLTGISGSLEMIKSNIQQGRYQSIERYSDAAQGAAKRAAALTHRLLAFSRQQTLEPKPTNVNRLALDMQDLIQRTVGPSIQVEVVGASGLWTAFVDVSQLENALLNLCINARDAMPDGGKIMIETSNKFLDESASVLHHIDKGQYLSLCVTDSGIGMSPEVIARAFEPFFTTKPLGEGTGLGLSMIYGFAQQSGGQVHIYSEVGHGSTVCIYLPRHQGLVDEATLDQIPVPMPRSEQHEIVLIVDDEPTIRMLLSDVLEQLGYVAIEAGDSEEGLKILQKDSRIDLLITDVGLPGGMNGRQMADAARVSRPDLKVLFITGYAENSILSNGHLGTGMAVLTKPFALETIAQRIRSMIEGK